VVIDTDLHPETLLVTCHNIVSQWHKDTIAATRQYAGLAANWTASYNLQDRNLSKIDVLQLMSSDSSSLRFVPNNILEDWRSALKKHRVATRNDFGSFTVVVFKKRRVSVTYLFYFVPLL
jgi:hypothetical protein